MRKKYDGWMRNPRTTQERRNTQKHNKYGRRSRNVKTLPTSYDDINIHFDRCWKSKRKTQYRIGGRGSRYEIFIEENRLANWHDAAYYKKKRLIDYFDKHDIAYDVAAISKVDITEELITTKRVCSGSETRECYIGKKIYRWTDYIWIDVPVKPYIKTTRWVTLLGYTIIYWTNKNIDLSYLL